MGGFDKDLRQAVRGLLGNPGFTAVTVLCLGLGIGANTAVFNLANSLFLRPLPVDAPESLVRAYTSYEKGLKWGVFSYLDFRDLQQRTDSGVELAAEQVLAVHLNSRGEGERAYGALVSSNYFQMLGLTPRLGRYLLPEDGEQALAVVVLSEGLWQRSFQADLSVIGQELVLNDRPFTIVGVAPERFTGTVVGFAPELWVPLRSEPQLLPASRTLTDRNLRNLLVVGRLQSGVGLAQARTSLGGAFGELATLHPDSNEGTYLTLIPEREGAVHPLFRGAAQGFLALLHGVMGLVLFLACANVATLLIARAARRRQEIAVRLALGASRARLLRQLLTESTMLALLAGAFGLLVALSLGRLVGFLTSSLGLPISLGLELDHRVLFFTLGISALTGLLFGLAPALQSVQTDLVSGLKDRGADQVPHRSRLQNALVIAQLTVSMVLLIAAGLLLRGLQQARSLDLGFESEGVVVASVDLTARDWEASRGRQFFQRVTETLERLPQVDSAGWTMTLPLSPFGGQLKVRPDGVAQVTGRQAPLVDYSVVSTKLFDTLGIELLTGRGFDPFFDRVSSEPKVVINQTLAGRFWPKDNPLGRRLHIEGQTYEVIGVAKDGRYAGLGEEASGYLYLSLEQAYRQAMTLAVKIRGGDPESFLPVLRQEMRQLDEYLPLFDIRTLEDHLVSALLPARAGAWAVNGFGLLAVLLAATGLYGILAYNVSQRAREIGIRMAVGAPPQAVLGLVLRQALRLALWGAALGLGLAALSSRLLTHFLYGVHPLDPLTFVTGSLALVLLTIGACWLPARRALRTDPAIVLRAT